MPSFPPPSGRLFVFSVEFSLSKPALEDKSPVAVFVLHITLEGSVRETAFRRAGVDMPLIAEDERERDVPLPWLRGREYGFEISFMIPIAPDELTLESRALRPGEGGSGHKKQNGETEEQNHGSHSGQETPPRASMARAPELSGSMESLGDDRLRVRGGYHASETSPDAQASRN